MTVTVLLVDDQELVRTGLRTVLDRHPDITVVGEAANGREAIAQATRLGPDVVLMDIRMPGMDGITAARSLTARSGGPRVVMLTTFDLDEYVYESFQAGASGFLLKDTRAAQLTADVVAVAEGDALLAPQVTRRLIERHCRPLLQPPPALGELTPREQEILVLVARGLSNAEIGERVYLSLATVKTHLGRVLAKLGLRDRVQAVVFAYEAGLVVPGDREAP